MTRGDNLLLRHRPGFWGALFFGSSAAVSALVATDAIGKTTGLILFAGVMILLIPMARAVTAKQRASGCASEAGVSYSRRMLAATFAYVLGLGVAITLHTRTELTGPAGFLIAMLPVVPIFGMIWAMGRYLRDEQDEYLRYRAVTASLVGLGAVLAIGSFWGFLETFEIVPHVPGWWAVPIWATGMGLGQLWMSLRDRGGSEE